jgi:hypothetical protein
MTDLTLPFALGFTFILPTRRNKTFVYFWNTSLASVAGVVFADIHRGFLSANSFLASVPASVGTALFIRFAVPI